MGMAKSSNAQIAGRVFTCLTPRMSSSARSAEVSFPALPGKIRGL